MSSGKKLEIPRDLREFIITDVGKEYEINKEIGSGGQSRVYLGKDRQTGSKVAIKELKKTAAHPKRQRQQYISEVITLYRCSSHPFLLHLIGFTDAKPYIIVTKYISSLSLAKFMTDRRFTVQSNNGNHLTKIALGIVSGMKFLHKMGIIHRDLKPGNILLDDKFKPVILDFGLVRGTDCDTPQTFEIGTPNWMAPEVIRGNKYTEKCDVFGFAMILYEMGTHKRPLAGIDGERIMNMYGNENFRPEFPTNNRLTPELKALIERCWNDNPNERPSFKEIYKAFASGSVKFTGAADSEVAKYVQEIDETEKRLKIVPPIEIKKKHGKHKGKEKQKARIEEESDEDVPRKHDKWRDKEKRKAELDEESDEDVPKKRREKRSKEKPKPKEAYYSYSDSLPFAQKRRVFDSDDDIFMAKPKAMPFQKQKLPAPEYHVHTLRTSYRKKAPRFKTVDLDMSSSQSEVSSDEDRDKYQPLDSPHYSTTINYGILSDSNHPLFQDEVQKVTKRNCGKFFQVVNNHLKGNFSSRVINILLRKSAEIIDDEDSACMFCEQGLFRILPLDDGDCLDTVCDVLETLFRHSPQYFQSNFEYGMQTLIGARPVRAIKLITIYGYSFEKIENPWPVLDLLIRHKKKLEKGKAGQQTVTLILHMLKAFKNYRDSRLSACRGVLVWFLGSKDRSTAVAAYKAITQIYDDEFDLDFTVIQEDVRNPEMVSFVVDLLAKIKEIPIVAEIIFPVCRAAKVNPKATALINKMLEREETAQIMLSYPKFLQYKLPTYFDTLQILMKMITYKGLRPEIAVCKEVTALFCRAVECKESSVYCCFERILKKVPFDATFLKTLQENDFFVTFFRGIVEIQDPDTTVSSLKALVLFARIGYVQEYQLFANCLKKYMSDKDDDIARMALIATSELSEHVKMRPVLEKLRVDQLARDFLEGDTKDYAKALIRNLR